MLTKSRIDIFLAAFEKVPDEDQKKCANLYVGMCKISMLTTLLSCARTIALAAGICSIIAGNGVLVMVSLGAGLLGIFISFRRESLLMHFKNKRREILLSWNSFSREAKKANPDLFNDFEILQQSHMAE